MNNKKDKEKISEVVKNRRKLSNDAREKTKNVLCYYRIP